VRGWCAFFAIMDIGVACVVVRTLTASLAEKEQNAQNGREDDEGTDAC
jgi:hypothetical protein